MLSIITHTESTVFALIGLNVTVLCASSKHSLVTPIRRRKNRVVRVCRRGRKAEVLLPGSRPKTRSPHFHVSLLRDSKRGLWIQTMAALHTAVFWSCDATARGWKFSHRWQHPLLFFITVALPSVPHPQISIRIFMVNRWGWWFVAFISYQLKANRFKMLLFCRALE